MSRTSRSKFKIDGHAASFVALPSKFYQLLYARGMVTMTTTGPVLAGESGHWPGSVLQSIYGTRYGVLPSGAIKRLDKQRTVKLGPLGKLKRYLEGSRRSPIWRYWENGQEVVERLDGKSLLFPSGVSLAKREKLPRGLQEPKESKLKTFGELFVGSLEEK